MKLLVNGDELDLAAETLAGLLASVEYAGEWLGRGFNGDLVHSDEIDGYVLMSLDRVEILSPMQGG